MQNFLNRSEMNQFAKCHNTSSKFSLISIYLLCYKKMRTPIFFCNNFQNKIMKFFAIIVLECISGPGVRVNIVEKISGH